MVKSKRKAPTHSEATRISKHSKKEITKQDSNDFMLLYNDLDSQLNNLCSIWLKFDGKITVAELLELLTEFYNGRFGYNEFLFQLKLINKLKKGDEKI